MPYYDRFISRRVIKFMRCDYIMRVYEPLGGVLVRTWGLKVGLRVWCSLVLRFETYKVQSIPEMSQYIQSLVMTSTGVSLMDGGIGLPDQWVIEPDIES